MRDGQTLAWVTIFLLVVVGLWLWLDRRCKHKGGFTWVRDFYGDEANDMSGRSQWRCRDCGKRVVRQYLGSPLNACEGSGGTLSAKDQAEMAEKVNGKIECHAGRPLKLPPGTYEAHGRLWVGPKIDPSYYSSPEYLKSGRAVPVGYVFTDTGTDVHAWDKVDPKLLEGEIALVQRGAIWDVADGEFRALEEKRAGLARAAEQKPGGVIAGVFHAKPGGDIQGSDLSFTLVDEIPDEPGDAAVFARHEATIETGRPVECSKSGGLTICASLHHSAGGSPIAYSAHGGFLPAGGLAFVDTLHFCTGDQGDTRTAGWTIEALLIVCADRLSCFQAGPYPCPENQYAIEQINKATNALHRRMKRVGR